MARLFVFINEVLSLMVVAANFVIGLGLMGEFGIWGVLYLFLSTLLLIIIFGFAALYIESHKAIIQIRDILMTHQTNSDSGIK